MEKINIPIANHHVGSTERVFVAHVNDLNDFYLHSITVRDSLLKLGQELYSEYSESPTKKSSVQMNGALSIGDYCACPSESEDWYRGIIRQIDSNGYASVFKIDYGDVEYLPLEYLQPLHEHFLKLDRLAFNCSLANLVKPVTGWSQEVIDEFHKRLTTTFLFAKFISYNEIRDLSEVELTEKSSKTSLNKDFQKDQTQRLIVSEIDGLLYKKIPLDKLDLTQPNEVRMLYYTCPGHFYVYLRDNTNAYLSFQNDLQVALQNPRLITSLERHQAVAVQDNHAIWHRAIILDFDAESKQVLVYFVDMGRKEYVLLNNMSALPEKFYSKPALGIPCRLYNICSLNGNDSSTWLADDAVHEEFNRLAVSNITCKVQRIQTQVVYEVDIDIPKIGDLGTFLLKGNLVSRPKMSNSQRSNLDFGQPRSSFTFARAQLATAGLSPARPPLSQRTLQANEVPGSVNTTIQHSLLRAGTVGRQHTALQQPPTTTTLPSTAPLQEGYYRITQVHSATEFYGVPKSRENELESLFKYFEDTYNDRIVNDQSLALSLFTNGTMGAIHKDDKYHRVTIKDRIGETRVLVKLIDHGDEIMVDTSELLNTDKVVSSLTAFAVPMRLYNADEIQSTMNVTQNLKRLILNQYVDIKRQGPAVNGFHAVDVTLANGKPLQQLLFSNKPIASNPTSTPPVRSNINSANSTFIESQIFKNSKFHSPNASSDLHERPSTNQGFQREFPTARPTHTSNFMRGADNLSSATMPSATNESISGFGNLNSRNNQQHSQATNSTIWNRDHNTRPTPPTTYTSDQQSSAAQRPSLSQFSSGPRPTDDRVPSLNSSNRLPPTQLGNSPPSYEKKNAFNSPYSRGGRPERQGRDDGSYENRTGRDAENFSGFNRASNQKDDDNKNDQSSHNSGFFQKRGGTTGFASRGGRFENSYDRNQSNNQDDNYTRTSQNFNNNRSEFRSNRNQDNFRGREHRGGSRGGRFPDSRGGHFNSRDRGMTDLQLSSDFKTSNRTFDHQTSAPMIRAGFEAGERYEEQEMPKDSFKFVPSHIEAVNDFYIQPLSKKDEITNLSEALQKEYCNAPEISLSSLRINQPCLAKCSDGCWYRAIVLVVNSNSTKVRFVDFGDTAEVDSKALRQLAKAHCAAPPYAYSCRMNNIEVLKNARIESIIDLCAERDFNGCLKSRESDNKFILESDDFLKVLLDTKAIKLKPKRTKCIVVHVEKEQRRFFIQNDIETADMIGSLVADEEFHAPTLSPEEIKELPQKSIVIALYDDTFYRAIVLSEESDDTVNVFYVDFGNVSSCAKASLKKCSSQLSSYPYQSIQCQFYGIPAKEIENAFEYLEEKSDVENIEFSVVNQHDQISDVLIYIDNECLNERFGYDPNATENNDIPTQENDQTMPPTIQSSEQNQEQQPSMNEKQVDDEIVLQQETQETTSVKEECPLKYQQGILSYVEPNEPYVYIQLLPESETALNEIGLIVDEILEKNEHNTSYNVGDHVIAQFSQDDQYYRARIESYSPSSNSYTVYFLDYGNMDENVEFDRLFSYSSNLEKIQPQAQKYLVNNISHEAWSRTVRSLLENQINETVEFSFAGDNKSAIDIRNDDIQSHHMKQTTPQITASINEQNETIEANISTTDGDCFYIHKLPHDKSHLCELEEFLQTCDKQNTDAWSINDLCIICCNEHKYCRGRILSINNETYDIKCIDYGNTVFNVSHDNLYILPNAEIAQQLPLAHRCQLCNIDDANQTKAIEEIIVNIPTTEHVTVHVQTNLNNECLLVKLVRENNDIVNDRYLYRADDAEENKDQQNLDNKGNIELVSPNSFNSNNTDESTGNSEQIAPEITVQQTENNDQCSNTIETNESQSLSTASLEPKDESFKHTHETINSTTQDETSDASSSN